MVPQPADLFIRPPQRGPIKHPMAKAKLKRPYALRGISQVKPSIET
jgi:hypothetical protein